MQIVQHIPSCINIAGEVAFGLRNRLPAGSAVVKVIGLLNVVEYAVSIVNNLGILPRLANKLRFATFAWQAPTWPPVVLF